MLQRRHRRLWLVRGPFAEDDGVVEVWGKDFVPESVDEKTVGEILGGEVFGDLVA